MRLLVAFVSLVLGLLPGAPDAQQRLSYGSKLGEEVTVISATGLDTERAVIVTRRRTREDAERFCVEYVGRVTPECIQRELSNRLNDRITANCRTGDFIDFYGRHHRFEGQASREQFRSELQPISLPRYALRDLARDELADGSNASGYPVNIRLFKALCPRLVPSVD